MFGLKNIVLKPSAYWIKYSNISQSKKLMGYPLLTSLKYTFAIKTVNLPFLADSIN